MPQLARQSGKCKGGACIGFGNDAQKRPECSKCQKSGQDNSCLRNLERKSVMQKVRFDQTLESRNVSGQEAREGDVGLVNTLSQDAEASVIEAPAESYQLALLGSHVRKTQAQLAFSKKET